LQMTSHKRQMEKRLNHAPQKYRPPPDDIHPGGLYFIPGTAVYRSLRYGELRKPVVIRHYCYASLKDTPRVRAGQLEIHCHSDASPLLTAFQTIRDEFMHRNGPHQN